MTALTKAQKDLLELAEEADNGVTLADAIDYSENIKKDDFVYLWNLGLLVQMKPNSYQSEITDVGKQWLAQNQSKATEAQADAGQVNTIKELELTEAQIAVIDELMKRNPASITRTRLIEMGYMRGDDCDNTVRGLINYGLITECEVFGRNGYELTPECEDYCQGWQYQDHWLSLKIDELNRRISIMQDEATRLIEQRAQLHNQS